MKLLEFLWIFLDVRLTAEQMTACRFCESRGLRFCVDFGYENASSKAEDIIERELAERSLV